MNSYNDIFTKIPEHTINNFIDKTINEIMSYIYHENSINPKLTLEEGISYLRLLFILLGTRLIDLIFSLNKSENKTLYILDELLLESKTKIISTIPE